MDDDEYIIVKKNNGGGGFGFLFFFILFIVILVEVVRGIGVGINNLADILKEHGLLKTQYIVDIEDSENDTFDISQISVMAISKSADKDYEEYNLKYNKNKQFRANLLRDTYDIYFEYDGGAYSFSEITVSSAGSLQQTLNSTSYINKGLVRLIFLNSAGNEIFPDNIKINSNEVTRASDRRFYVYCNHEDIESWLISISGYEDIAVNFSTAGIRVCDLRITLENSDADSTLEEYYESEKSEENAVLIGCAISGDVSIESMTAENVSNQEKTESIMCGSEEHTYVFNGLSDGMYEISATLSNGETITRILQVHDEVAFYFILLEI